MAKLQRIATDAPPFVAVPRPEVSDEIAAAGFWRSSHAALGDHFAQMCIRSAAATFSAKGRAA